MTSTPLRAAIAVVVLLAAFAVTGVRVWRKYQADGGAVATADFRDVIYWPTRAVAVGLNPYDSDTTSPAADGGPKYRARFPAQQMFPLYSPLLFALFFPFATPPYEVAAGLWLVFGAGLLVLYSYALWRLADRRPTVEAVCYLAAVMLVLQSGRPTFVSGQTSLFLALAVLVAIACRGAWSGVALALTSIKPTFGLPLGLALLARGEWRTVLVGWGLGLVLGVAGLALIFSRAGDLDRVGEVLTSNQHELESDPDADARTSSVRLDSVAAFERLLNAGDAPRKLLSYGLVAAPTLAAAYLLGRRRENAEAALLADALTFVAPVAMIYHLTYDGLALWGALALLILSPRERFRRLSLQLRHAIAGCIFFTQINCLMTPTVIGWFDALGISARTMPPALVNGTWTAVSIANGAALWIAVLLILVIAIRWDSATTSRRLGNDGLR